MFKKLKDFWSIFKNSRQEFYKDKYKAVKLLERVKHLNDITLAVLEKNKEILHYLDLNIYNYPKYMFSYINDLVSLFKCGCDSKTITNKSFSFIYVLLYIRNTCNATYNSMNENFNKRNFATVEEEYIELIKNLKEYEKKYNMIILDDFYDYNKI